MCIKENLRNFEIKPKDGELIPYIYLTYKLDEIKNRYFVDFEAVFDLISISPEELGLDRDKIHLNEYMYNKVKMVKNRLPIITQHELTIFKFFSFFSFFFFNKLFKIIKLHNIKITRTIFH